MLGIIILHHITICKLLQLNLRSNEIRKYAWDPDIRISCKELTETMGLTYEAS